jgi:hypothetical protein
MSAHRIRVVLASIVAFTVWASCGPKENGETTPRRTDPEPRGETGPPKKLMPPEMRAEVEQVFNTQKAELERCYNDYVVNTGKTKLRGTVIIAVTIGLTPRPTKVWFLKNTFKNEPKLVECFLGKIQRWLFPTWGGVMDYSFRSLTLEEM